MAPDSAAWRLSLEASRPMSGPVEWGEHHGFFPFSGEREVLHFREAGTREVVVWDASFCTFPLPLPE